jgi:5-methylcytosine-specific restriction protein A
MSWPFFENKLYNRRADIHAIYGGQQQGGIATPVRVPAIFLFTGHGAQKHGYADEFLPDGSFRYTGEGQVGDMQMRKGNLAIATHAANGKDILVFRKSASRQPVEYVGQFVCAGWDIERQPDTEGNERDAIVFRLVRLETFEGPGLQSESQPDSAKDDFDQLRAKAYDAVRPAAVSPTERPRTIYQRSRDVRQYVLVRSKGRCEACSDEAPFLTAAGSPYLEPHHIRRVSDGGLDHPAHVAAICPNCHRRAHYGADATDLNTSLAAKITALEAQLPAL